MNKIHIFNREIEDGVADQVTSQASIAYCTPVSINEDSEVSSESIASIIAESEKSKADDSEEGHRDLYRIEAVLVSTNWNGNDDVFLPEPTWAARNTPVDKQFTFMHDENDIIGHILASRVVDPEGNAISSDTDTAPENFDIITESVLYNSWVEPANQYRMASIISEIKEGKWFVSMECSFAGFDYSVISPKGENYVIARDEESAFLTKHLRSYGGSGEYDGFRVGRALKEISFSGKGLVSNPANPRSIILNSKSVAFSVDSTNLIGDISMSDSKILEDRINELKSDLATANDSIAKFRSEAEKVPTLTTQVETLEASIVEKDEAIAGLEQQVSEAAEAATKLTETLEETKTAMAADKEKIDEMEKEKEEMKKKEKARFRKAALIEAGMDAAQADENLASFDALDDDAFAAVVALYADKQAVATETTEETEEEVAEAEVETTEEVFEDLKSEDPSLVVAEKDEAQEVMSARAELSDWISGRLKS